MKLLIMCEGPNELKIINILLENQKLKFHQMICWAWFRIMHAKLNPLLQLKRH